MIVAAALCLAYLVTHSTRRCYYPGGNNIFLAWSSPDVHRVCASGDALAKACPSPVAARLLLSVIAHAPTLFAVARLRSIGVRPTDPATGRIVVEHKEVVMHAAVLNRSGHALEGKTEAFWTAALQSTALRVDDIRVDGTSLVRNAG
jgi:hypothetical protein